MRHRTHIADQLHRMKRILVRRQRRTRRLVTLNDEPVELPQGQSAARRRKALLRRIYRLRVLKLLGSACVCCGERDPVMLTIDHRLDNGTKERQKHRGSDYYRKMLSHPRPHQMYRVLCHNYHDALNYYGHCSHGRTERPTISRELERAEAERWRLLACN